MADDPPCRPVRALVLKSNDYPVGGVVRSVEMYVGHQDRALVEPVIGHVDAPGQPGTLLRTSPRAADLEHHDIVWPGLRRAKSAAAALRDLVRDAGIDVVTSNDMRSDYLCRLAGGRRGLGVPWTAFVHGLIGFRRRPRDMVYGVYELIERWAVRAADQVWTPSHACARDVRRLLPPRVPITVLHNGIDPYYLETGEGEVAALRASLDLPDDAMLVGTLGRMQIAKGHALLADAVVRSGRTNLIAVLLGFGEEMDGLRRMADRPPYRGRVIIPGEKESMERVGAWLGALDVFCFPSLQESLPLVILEAMAAGCVIASSATGDIPLVLENGEAGLLFPPGDVDAMAVCLRRLAEDGDLRARLRRRAGDRFEEQFTAERFGRDIGAAWLAVAGRDGHGTGRAATQE